MKLIVGLGNPGKKYQQTWHNVGFLIVDQIQQKKPETFLKFKKSAKHKAEICEGGILEKIILTKPQTFMNNSGQAVKSLLNFYKIKSPDLWVIHDDIDLPIGKIRISQNSSAAGHNGIKSIINELGTKEFVRFRIGIQPLTPMKVPTDKYVLQKINKTDKVKVDEVVQKTIAAIDLALDQGISETMNEFN
ncbi:MAG: aminoacyl-tRNA hydrolase [Parcubacteria group bacterium]|nr:aminoacyl-tRNA hydrolase [Parcubacteria group bacterium]|tara:strand:+ start:10155 stop:10724 length:570 start_codon:yes stop_codon:yes gene_type:complete